MRKNARRSLPERITTDDLLLQPWFLPLRIARAMRSLLPPDFRKRLHDAFDDYGCLRCGRTNVPYRSHGMCDKCIMTIAHKVYTAASRRSKERMARRYGKEFVSNERHAKRLLRGLASQAKQSPKRRKMVDLGSPLASAFEKFG
jgi:hypothetical protein